MTRSELIARMIEKHPEITAQDVTQTINELFEVMIDSLSSGNRIELRGFGVFSLRLRKASIARSPISSRQVAIPAKYVCHFKTGSHLHQNLNAQPK